MENKKKYPSWIAIVIWFICFWPVGLFLLFKRVTNDKAAAMKNSKILRGIGIFFMIMGVFAAFSSSDDIGIALFYIIGGLLIVLGASKVKKSGELYKKYIDIVINQEQRTIENIASQMGLPYDQAVKGLQQMIDKGYFAGAYIDQVNHEIVFRNKTQQAQTIETTDSAPKMQQKMLKCPNCGGNNLVSVGQVCECDFCGSPIG